MSDLSEFRQTDMLRDTVFPLVDAEPRDDGAFIHQIVGTGFFIGDNLAMTARHVVEAASHHLAMMVVAPDNTWRLFSVRSHEPHSTEDVSVLDVSPPSDSSSWKTIFGVASNWVGSAQQVHLWGYPMDLYHEMIPGGSVGERPDLVYCEGYIHRRMSSVPMAGIRGSQLLELSFRAGRGCSGAPVMARYGTRFSWDVLGIYIGEREGFEGRAVGYAVRFDALAGWSPQVAGREVVPAESAPRLPARDL